MTQVDAIFRHGKFEPLEPVEFKEEQRVRLSIDDKPEITRAEWLEQTQKLHDAILKRRNQVPLPSSTEDIAADRMR